MRLQLYVTGQFPVYTMCSQFKHYVVLVNLPHSPYCPMFPYYIIYIHTIKMVYASVRNDPFRACFLRVLLLWNNLPASLGGIGSIIAFKSGLKTFLFGQEYENSRLDYVILPETYWLSCFYNILYRIRFLISFYRTFYINSIYVSTYL